MTPFERGFIKAAEAGLSEEQARSTMNIAHQQLMAQNDKRQRSPAKLQQIEQAKGKMYSKTILPTVLGTLVGHILSKTLLKDLWETYGSDDKVMPDLTTFERGLI